uniref:Uncharacterized protein n=1 Tax=Glossina brevipalpis TaxID=37001 RepID=A0A1A9WNA4_9MUSC
MKEQKIIGEKVSNESNNKTIVDMIYEDFSTTPFNNPITSPASRLKALKRSPLFIVLEKPKRDLVPIEDTLTDEQILDLNFKKSEVSHRDYDGIGEKETFKVNQTSVPSNHDRSDIDKNYHWDEDDDDVFTSIDMQQILKQNVQDNKSFFNIPVFPLNKCETQGTRKLLAPQEGKQSVGHLAQDICHPVNEILIENELKELKNEKEAIKINNQESSLTHLDFQTSNNNQIAMSEEKEYRKYKIEYQLNRQNTVKNSIDSSVQITVNTGFRTTNGKDISISKEGKKRLEDLLKELNQSANADNTEVG